MFDKGYFDNDWYENAMDFLSWCNGKIKECQPRGICPQSIYIQSGKAGFDRKYPDFETAYREYIEEFEATRGQ